MQPNMDYTLLKGAFLKGRTAVVAGGGPLGDAVAQALAGFGAIVTGTTGDEAVRAIEDADSVDILVNCPAFVPAAAFLESSVDDWRGLVETTLVAALAACRAAVPRMLEKGYGRIVNVMSVAGKMGLHPYGAHVCAAAAMHGLTKSLAREFASRGIAVNTVGTGILPEDLKAAPALSEYVDWTSVPRPCTHEEVAKAVAFLAAEQAGFFTGCCLDVNGGLYMD